MIPACSDFFQAAMTMYSYGRGLISALLVLMAIAGSAQASDAEEQAIRLVDVSGQEHRPFADPKTKAVALVFILTDCPIANSYAPEWNRLHETFGPRGVRLLLVQVDPSLTAEAARKHAREYQLKPQVILDPRHELVKKAGATKTPEAAVFSAAGKLLYRGRIDDRYVSLGKRRPEATTHDLRDALQAILAGKPVPPGPEAVGCFIPELPQQAQSTRK
jgi:hypothetical protein